MVKISSAGEGCISMGPWGGQQGEPWSYKVDGRITQIIVGHGCALDSLLFQSQSCGCFTPETSHKFGGPGGSISKVCIDSRVEHLSSMSLTFGAFGGGAVTSITFHTNLTEYGPYGLKDGTEVSIPIEGGVVVGFHGRAGRFINAVGFYVKPKINTFCPENLPNQIQSTMSSMKLVVPRDPGPWGASGGKLWDDGVFPAIKKVFLMVNVEQESTSVLGLQFQYEKENGICFRSPWHGSSVRIHPEISPANPWATSSRARTTFQRGTSSVGSASELSVIELDYPSEVIVGMEGYYGPVIESKHEVEAVTSITFYTNKQKYGPYGDEIGTHFSSMQYSGGIVVGFFGRSGTHLNAIGVHMAYY